MSSKGKVQQGVVEARDKAIALDLLARQGIKPFCLEPNKSKTSYFAFGRSPLGVRWRASFYLELATLLKAGVGLDQSLRIVADGLNSSGYADVVLLMADAVGSGKKFSESLQETGRGFTGGEVGQIRAGEQTGNLSQTLTFVAGQLKGQIEIRTKVASALVYPAFLMTLAPISLIVIATVLMPSLVPLFEETKAPMPFALSAMLVARSELVNHGLLWLLAVAFVVLGLLRAPHILALRRVWDVVEYRIPVIGKLKTMSVSGRFASVFAGLLSNGVPLQTSLQLTAESLSSNVTRDEIIQARLKVIEGKRLTSALSEVRILQKKTLQLIAIGEETNQLPEMLRHISEQQAKSFNTEIERLTTLLSPILTILMGLLVGGIVMSVMRAILSINQLAGQ